MWVLGPELILVSTVHLQVTKARFPLPELTARVDWWPVSITHQRGRVDGRAFALSTSRVDGPNYTARFMSTKLYCLVSLPFHKYQIIMLGDRDTCVKLAVIHYLKVVFVHYTVKNLLVADLKRIFFNQIIIIIFRLTPKSRPNNLYMGLRMSFRPYIRPQKVFPIPKKFGM